MVNAIDSSEQALYHIVEIYYDGMYERFTNWDTSLEIAGQPVVSLPTMEIDLAPTSGVFQETPTRIKMKIDSNTEDFLDPVSRGTPFPPTRINVLEIIHPTNIGDASSTKYVASGRLYRCVRNVDGKTGLVALEVRSEKSLLDVRLGFQITAHCPWRLNGKGCRGPTWGPSGYSTAVVGITIDGKVVIANDTGLVLDRSGSQSWTRGFLEKDGARVMIFYYDKTQDGNTTKHFLMSRQPPAEWDGENVTFYPGCTKEIDGDGGCRDAWNNEEGFGGSGIAIPAHNPITENPQGD